MAGDWIKMRAALAEDPAVIGIAGRCQIDEFAVVGRLHHFWSWLDEQSRDGHARGVTVTWIDRYVQRDGFASAMVEVGWLRVTSRGIDVPHFDRHNGETAKSRALATKRKAKQRAGVTLNPEAGHGDVVTKTGPEKRREEKRRTKTPSVSVRAAKKCPESFVLNAELRDWARHNAPGVDIDSETESMRDHTFATARVDWPGTWRNWLRKAEKALPNGHSPTFRDHDVAAKAELVRKQTGGLLNTTRDDKNTIEMETRHAAIAHR